MRLKYPNSLEHEELITSLTKVIFDKNDGKASLIFCPPFTFQGFDSYNAYEKDIAVVNIFFGGSTAFGKIESQSLIFWHNYSMNTIWHNWYDRYVPEFERSPRMTWLDFISGLGGICGLCLGISFVSLVEIIYWFSVRLFRTFWSANVGLKSKSCQSTPVWPTLTLRKTSTLCNLPN